MYISAKTKVFCSYCDKCINTNICDKYVINIYLILSVIFNSFPMSLYLVVTEFWVHNEHMTGSPQTTIFISFIPEVTIIEVVSSLHRDQSKEPTVIRTTGTEG